MGRKRTAFPDLCWDVWISIADFHSKYDIDPVTGCWNFVRGAAHRLGYRFIGGRDAVTDRRRMLTAHRVSWRIHHGAITQPNINHLCHNRQCVNPAHLYQGDQRSNMRDMWAAGRAPQQRGNQRPRPHKGLKWGPRNLTQPGQQRRVYLFTEDEVRLNRIDSIEAMQARYPGLTRRQCLARRGNARRGYPWIK
jgi:hypothetical protein